jgi:geranyl-CoA carboxylase alpha subunit
MFRSILVANRGEIALRVMRTARAMGLRVIAVYSEADRDARHAREADASHCIGGPAPRDSYLNVGSIIDAAKKSGAEAIHPGYGFLAESAQFAQAVLDAGLTWIGPTPAAIRAMADKGAAKRLMRDAGVPVLATYAEGDKLQYPVMIKAAAGGGGRGMRLVRSKAELAEAFAQAQSEAEHAFGDARLLIEPALEGARHVEVQVFADSHGNVVHLGERDCSVQRRHQKLIEESPSPAVDAPLRGEMGKAAIAAARSVGYAGAGTVEFLLGADRKFWFMEMNTRLQVEHPVTEAITGLDLVEWQLRVARGEALPLRQDEIRFSGHAIEVRLCAEDPEREFLPQAGNLAVWQPASGVRTDHALESGAQILPWYDSMIAKVIAHGASRDEARERLAQALDATVALGVPTNKSFLAEVLREPSFARGEATTQYLATHKFAAQQPDPTTCAIGAALLAHADGFGEWTRWSNNPAHGMRARFGETDVALASGDRSVRVLAVEGHSARVESQGREETVHFALEGNVLHLARGAASYRLENTLLAPPAKRAGHVGDGRLAAPMNGRVVAVHAKAGERFDAGSLLVVLEAMKMEHGLSLPAPVKVKAVHVAAGVQVSPGQLLVEFEPA